MPETNAETEEKLEQIIFMDTNVIVPQSSWDFYNFHLNKFRESPLTGNKFPTYNSDLDESYLEKALRDASLIRKVITDETRSLAVTRGVYKQSEIIIDKITENIDSRSQNFIFTEFYPWMSENTRGQNRRINTALFEYSKGLMDIKKTAEKKQYSNPKEEPYFILTNFVRAIKDEFFDIVKKDHNYDFNTDEYIAVACLYESIANKKQVCVMSNDGDVSRIIGSSEAIFRKVRILVEPNEKFNFFYNHPIKVYNVFDYNKKAVLVDTQARGEECIKCLDGFDLTKPEELKEQYLQKLSKFSTFLKRTIEELNESLAEKANTIKGSEQH